MKTIKLKTNINCGSCVAKVTPVLDEVAGKNNWKVDTGSPSKILTITGEDPDLPMIIDALQKRGYRGEVMASEIG